MPNIAAFINLSQPITSLLQKLKYLPNLPAAISFFLSVMASQILFFGRNLYALRIKSILTICPDFYTHISNFTITYLLIVISGIIPLCLGLNKSKTFASAVIFTGISTGYELAIPLLNTPDIIDAYYGICGGVLAFLFLGILSKFGLSENPQYNL